MTAARKEEIEPFYCVPVCTTQFVKTSRVEDLLCNAFEGGSNYWINTTWVFNDKWPEGSEYASEVPTRGGTVVIVTDEDEILIGSEEMLEGLKLLAEEHPHHWKLFLEEQDDAETADIFLQLACFGELVYG